MDNFIYGISEPADLPKSLKDWEAKMRELYQEALKKLVPEMDGFFVFQPSESFPKELIPRLNEFGFKLFKAA